MTTREKVIANWLLLIVSLLCWFVVIRAFMSLQHHMDSVKTELSEVKARADSLSQPLTVTEQGELVAVRRESK